MIDPSEADSDSWELFDAILRELTDDFVNDAQQAQQAEQYLQEHAQRMREQYDARDYGRHA